MIVESFVIYNVNNKYDYNENTKKKNSNHKNNIFGFSIIYLNINLYHITHLTNTLKSSDEVKNQICIKPISWSLIFRQTLSLSPSILGS